MPQPRKPAGERRDCTCPRARHQHGTIGGYHADKCRCRPCRAASREERAAHTRRTAYATWSGQHLRVSPVGTRRRLQALAAIGWTIGDLARRLDVTMQAVSSLRDDARDTMFASTAAKIGVLYDELSLTVPQGGYHQRARNIARRKGWAPPLAWDDDTIDDPAAKPAGVRRTPDRSIDEVAVAEALAGRSVALTRHERAAAVRLAAKRGLGAERTAELLGTTTRTVGRDRAKVAA